MSAMVNSGFILIVDDNPTNLAVLSEALSSAGFHFRVATDGESALALVARNRPELILLDVQMPGIDGFETCRRLKANADTQAIPVIFTTALSDTESKAKGFSLGAVDYIPKPFDQTEVLVRLRVHLQLKYLTDSLEQQVSERTAALHQMQVQLVQQEKLSSLGEMMAGIAHEMNNPINFMVSNIRPLEEYIAEIIEILNLYQQEHLTPSSQLKNAIEEIDLDFVLEDVGKILDSFQLGSERIRGISKSLRMFARSDSETKAPADLHAGLDSTLIILQHRLKGKGGRDTIKVFKSYGKLPPVHCYSGPMNQVFMNLLANSIDALEEAIDQEKLQDSIPQIHITTQVVEQTVVVQLADNGVGIPEPIQERLFEPLFTTKPVGKGTGLGLAIAHQIVVKKHQGSLTVKSPMGQGTIFTITLPIAGAT